MRDVPDGSLRRLPRDRGLASAGGTGGHRRGPRSAAAATCGGRADSGPEVSASGPARKRGGRPSAPGGGRIDKNRHHFELDPGRCCVWGAQQPFGITDRAGRVWPAAESRSLRRLGRRTAIWHHRPSWPSPGPVWTGRRSGWPGLGGGLIRVVAAFGASSSHLAAPTGLARSAWGPALGRCGVRGAQESSGRNHRRGLVRDRATATPRGALADRLMASPPFSVLG